MTMTTKDMFDREHATTQENELLFFFQIQNFIVKSGRFVQDAQPPV